jgi:phage repressor protein C with HTH and peptisase S24 domain
VSAGSGVYIDSNIRQREMVEVPVNEKTAKASFVLTVKGDSMEPRYSDGDEILIQSMPSVDIGDLGIFILNDEVYFKRMGRKGLESLNPKYPVINVTKRYIVCKGKVIGKL